MLFMKTWNLKADDPGAFCLAADARCGPTDYVNDQIWDLHLGRSEPPSLALRTTFGLRAQSLRMFPRFIEGDTSVDDPSTFSSPPIVKRFYPNYLQAVFSPLMGIDVLIEYWVPSSHSITGRVQITNSRLSARQFRFEWAALLRPSAEGQRMASTKLEAATVLCGQTDGIAPVVFLTGGPEASSGPYPALSIDLDLAPGGMRQFTWAHAGLAETESSFELVKELVSRAWASEIAHLDVLNGRLLEIETGNEDWDLALSLAQKTALNMFVGPTEHLPEKSFVLSRQPDKGYSPRGDGNDYTYFWNGQSVMEADYLINLILPSSPGLAKGILRNFISTQTQKGFIDLKPGLGGQRGRLLATPLLANMAWRIYQATEDREFLAEIYPQLISFVHAWFTSEQDRDGDGLPEWAHPIQSGYEDHPAFSQWQDWAQGADITQSESPSLCAFLYNEIQILIQISNTLEMTGPITALEALADNLKSAIKSVWDDKAKIYRHWDRETHLSPPGRFLGSREGPGEIILEEIFLQPVRLLIQIQASEERSRQAIGFIHGTGVSDRHRVESVSEERFQWYLGRGNVTSERVYQSVEHIQITGINDEDQVTVRIVDLSVQDQTLLLPLWSGIPDKTRAKHLIKQTITDETRFWQEFGIPAYIHYHSESDADPCHNVYLPWNNLIGEGLVRYGYDDVAVELFTRLMNGIIKNLKRDHTFFQNIHSQTGQGAGERYALNGLPPLGLFLEILGVRILSSRRVALRGHNPFQMPVTLKFRGLTILREKNRTKITFPGGQTAVVRNPTPRIVTIEE